MRNDYTDITILLDRSGSMSHLTEDTIGGFNTLLEKQRQEPGELRVTLCQFPDKFSLEVESAVLTDRNILIPRWSKRGKSVIKSMNYTYLAADVKAVKNLDHQSYIADGSCTPLRDYFGRIVQETGERLAAMKEEDRPSRVLIITITDGLENASETYTKQQVNEMQKHQEEKYGWNFQFVGTNGLDLDEATDCYGETLTSGGIQVSARNTTKGFTKLSDKMSAYRSVDANLTPGEFVMSKKNALNYSQAEKDELAD